MPNLFNNPTIKYKKKYQKNEYISFLNLTSDNKMLLFYHKSMINIDLLQKKLIPSLIEKSNITPNLETLDIPGLKLIDDNELDSHLFGVNIIIYNYSNKKLYSLND